MEQKQIDLITAIHAGFKTISSNVDQSTGSLHTKDDVSRIINDMLYMVGKAIDDSGIMHQQFPDPVTHLSWDELDAAIDDIDYQGMITLEKCEFEIINRNEIYTTENEFAVDTYDLMNAIKRKVNKTRAENTKPSNNE